MSAALQTVSAGEYVPTADGRVVMYGVRWSHYEALLALRGDTSSPRISYLDGAIELMRPSKDHERIKSYIGRLVETFAIERGIELSPYGSWTLKQAPKEAGVEPDECYLIGVSSRADQARETPDLVIEVVWTSGGIDKLEAYRRLGVDEVWFWKNDALQVYVRRADAYVPVQESAALPGLDLALLCAMLEHPTATQAIKAFRAALTA
jgi:Uma2 family endonuclease